MTSSLILHGGDIETATNTETVLSQKMQAILKATQAAQLKNVIIVLHNQTCSYWKVPPRYASTKYSIDLMMDDSSVRVKATRISYADAKAILKATNEDMARIKQAIQNRI